MYQTPNYNFHVPDTPNSIFQQLKLLADDIDAALQTVDGGGGTGGGGGYINPTTGYIPVRSSATSFADSLISDTGSSININGPVSITGGLTINGVPITPPTPHPVTSVFGRTGVITAQFGDYPVPLGGTGNNTYVIGDILYADSASSLARLADKATFNVLISGGVGVAPSWGKVNLNNAVTGLLPVTSGGTGTPNVFTAGSVVFARAAGLYTENNANFFWDNTNFRLGIGTATPQVALQVVNSIFVSSNPANLYLFDIFTGWLANGTLVVRPQPNNSVWSTLYTAGLSGWAINATGNAEFNNVSIRGELRTSVFKVNEIAATAGTFGVFYSASTLTADCTIPNGIGQTISFTAKNSDAGGMLFAVSDVIRFKAYVNQGGLIIADTWATISTRTNNGATTTYTAVNVAGSINTVFRAGTAVLDYGPNGTGFITLSTDGTVGATPNLTMATHTGTPWTSFTTLLRLGNLNGSYDYASNIYGFATGQWGTGAWVTVDSTNGVRIGTGSTTTILLRPDGSGYLASNNISWTAAGVTTIAGWTINPTSISSGVTVLASNLDIVAGQIAWFGKSATGYMGWNLTDSGGRKIQCLVNNSTLYPYMAFSDNTYRVLIGGLNNAWNPGDTTDATFGMKIYNSAGTKLVEFSNIRNQIAGWDISTTAISNIVSGNGLSLNTGGGGGGLYCQVSSIVVAQVDGNRGFDCKIDSNTMSFALTRAYTITDVATGLTAASFHSVLPSTTENVANVYCQPVTSRNSTIYLVASAPAGKNATAGIFSQVGGTNYAYIYMDNVNGMTFWTNQVKRMSIDQGTVTSIWGNLNFQVPQDGTNYGISFINTTTGTGCGGVRQFVSGTYNQVQVGSNAPSGGNTQHGLVYFTSQDNSNQNSANFYLVSELNLGSRIACYPITGTFKGFLISDVLVDGPAPNAGALLQLNSTTKGLLLPRVTIAQRNAIGASNGTVLFNTDNQVPSFVCSGAWRDLVRGVLTRVSSTVNLSCPNNTTTVLNWNDENLDPDGMWDGSFPSGIAPRVLAGAGTYLVTGQVQMIAGAPAVGYSQLSIRKNRGAAGDVVVGACTLQNTGNHTSFEVSTIVTLNVNDYVELQFYTSCGATVTLAGASPQTPQFWVLKISGFSG